MTRFARLACCLLLAAACGATSIVPMSVEQLTAAAADVVEARAVRSWSSWNAQHSIIYTYTEFAVTRRLKGSLPGSITVKQMGGSAEGYTQSVAGVRRFQDGEDALLFLRPSATNDGTQVIVGLVQGNFRIWNAAGRRMASNGVPHVNAIQGAEVRSFGGASLELDELESRVRKAVTQ